MTTRRVLRGVLNELATSFVGRNNDVDGYWAIGLLRSSADQDGMPELLFDLVNGTAKPAKELTQKVAAAYAAWLKRRLAKVQLPFERLVRAEVQVRFGEYEGAKPPPQLTWGEPFTCFIRLMDDHGRAYERTVSSWCGPHDPSREWRRTFEHGGLDG